MKPTELAAELGVDPKTLRAWLRRNYPRTPREKGQRWPDLSTSVITSAREHFGGSRK